jgi:hypothetical protein
MRNISMIFLSAWKQLDKLLEISLDEKLEIEYRSLAFLCYLILISDNELLFLIEDKKICNTFRILLRDLLTRGFNRKISFESNTNVNQDELEKILNKAILIYHKGKNNIDNSFIINKDKNFEDEYNRISNIILEKL